MEALLLLPLAKKTKLDANSPTESQSQMLQMKLMSVMSLMTHPQEQIRYWLHTLLPRQQLQSIKLNRKCSLQLTGISLVEQKAGESRHVHIKGNETLKLNGPGL